MPGRVQVSTTAGRILRTHLAIFPTTVLPRTGTPPRTSCLARPRPAAKERKVSIFNALLISSIFVLFSYGFLFNQRASRCFWMEMFEFCGGEMPEKKKKEILLIFSSESSDCC